MVTLASFPAKSADYLASGKPILVLAPRESTVVQYLEPWHCAELVTEPDKDALGKALGRLASGEEYRRRLASSAQHLWDTKRHNIVRQQKRLIEVVRSLTADKNSDRRISAP